MKRIIDISEEDYNHLCFLHEDDIYKIIENSTPLAELDNKSDKPTIIDWNNCHTEEHLKQATLDSFITYAKKNFGIELTVKKSDNPDTVEKLFGVVEEVSHTEGMLKNEID